MKRKDMKIDFENAQELKRQYLDTFYAPSQDELKKVKPGEIVKVCAFRERFWVVVTAVEGDTITGWVNNDLLTTELEHKDTITFKMLNVYIIWSIEQRALNRQQQKTPAKRSGKAKENGRRW